MTDLDQREQPCDAMLRAAASRLREELGRAAVPPMRIRRRSHRRRWVITVVAAVAAIVGLVAIGTNRNDQSVGNDPDRLRWLVTDLPDGWKAVGAYDAVSQPDDGLVPMLINVYATDDAPAGPILSVQASKGDRSFSVSPGDDRRLTNYDETSIEGHRAVFADNGGGRALYIEIDAHWVLLEARNIDDATLGRLGISVVRNDDGSAEVPIDALVSGLRLVIPASSPPDPMMVALPGADVAVSRYAASGTDGTLTMSVGARRVAIRAWDALALDVKPINVGTAFGYIGSDVVDSVPPTTLRVVYAEFEGLAFRLSGNGMSETELISAARSVTRASTASWTALVQPVAPVAPAGTEPAVTTRDEGAPPGTDPPFTGEAHDVAIEVSVAEISANEQVWSGTLPTGETWSVDVRLLYDTMSIWWQMNGASQGGMTGIAVPRAADQQLGCCPPYVVTTDPAAAALRVLRSNGDRYTTPLHDLPGDGGLRAAFIDLPNGGGVQRAELLDASGNVLDR